MKNNFFTNQPLIYNTYFANTGLSQKCVRSLFKEIRELIAEDITTYEILGGPGTIVAIDEAKFGKLKYSRGRLVEGSWVIGGVQRQSNRCFLTVCPQNSRSEPSFLPIIQRNVAPGTVVITDKWKGYVNFGNHGYWLYPLYCSWTSPRLLTQLIITSFSLNLHTTAFVAQL